MWISINGNSINGNLYKWGKLERLYSFPYKLTSLNGEVGNGGPKRLRNHFVDIKFPLYLRVLCIFPPKNAKFWEFLCHYMKDSFAI